MTKERVDVTMLLFKRVCMYKKLKYLLLTVFIFGIGFFYLATLFDNSRELNTPCPFCDSHIVNHQKFYEDDLVIALCTHKPIVSNHFLVIPKRHVERLEMLLPEEMARIHEVIGKVNEASKQVFHTSPYFVHQKNGREVGQSVPHVHFHYIAIPPGDDSYIKFFINMIKAQIKGPLSSKELHDITEKMKVAMDST